MVLTSRPPSLLRHLRTKRLPNQSNQSSLRLFTQKHPLLLITRTSSPRPQLPYLSQPSRNVLASRQTARFLTTENKNYVKEQVWLAAKWSAVGWSFFLLGVVALYGINQEVLERKTPSPEEWSFFSRNHFRCANAAVKPDHEYTDWAQVATEFRRCLERLEDEAIDGKGTTPLVPGMEHIRGINPSAFDVQDKSAAWKEGYFQVVMNCARASEHIDNMVLDTSRGIVFPKDVVIGPSNPSPRPCPPGAESAPREEDCEQAYAPPETFYLKVLTGVGFSTRHRIQAALAYANWLEIKGLNDSADETYKWAVDIAASALPAPEQVIDAESSILRVNEVTPPSPNILTTATALATHRARSGNITSALPIFLSVLRARHAAPVDIAPPSRSEYRDFTVSDPTSTDIGAFFNIVKSLFTPPTYPSLPPSGDEPFLRLPAHIPDCTEAELMLYIGEILFATAAPGREDEGLGWTKNAVAIAEQGVSSDALPANKDKCRACLETGIANWGAMVTKLLREETAKGTPTSSSSSWGSWFGGSEKQENKTNWEDELRAVEEVRMNLVAQGINSKLAAAPQRTGTFIG
ncbi:hypothetical protein D6D10_09182 [Aureobasidium pullulans]|uniref:MFS maltose permease n=1 Tax=Aureobasidium pullulans TaxID=5580 RepID=A0A4S9E8K5_AURPU|nr:hypothetical protein D6D10_09182 [Aureobasidium pullulans]